MIRIMSTNAEFMIAISHGGMAMWGQRETAFTGLLQARSATFLVRPISASAARPESVERLICSA